MPALISDRSAPGPMAKPDSSQNSKTRAAEQALDAYGLRAESLEYLDHGLINRTWRVRGENGASYALQRLSPILGPEIHEDIEVVTAHIAARGMATPRLVGASAGGLYVEREDGVWRLLTWLEGEFHNRLENTGQAEQAGALLARFHMALADFDRPFASKRRPIHEPERRIREMEQALAAHRGHPLHAEAERLQRRTLELMAQLPAMPETPLRVAHGDPKINNMLFSPEGEGLAMLDLDSLGRLSLPYELGDAFRSWCNPMGEDSEETEFSVELFEAARSGYLDVATFIAKEERSCLVDATLWITLELTTRFTADILNDRYFGWDPRRFASRAEHNLVRARGQLRLAESLLSVRPTLLGARA
ncbi:MAG: aminoglycoside phosphotransferase family protein [Gammaproteobacteria bacterium]|nr:aminoglycoside phosphotransferase family protein [Gammaproteobacteria bacterium]